MALFWHWQVVFAFVYDYKIWWWCSDNNGGGGGVSRNEEM